MMSKDSKKKSGITLPELVKIKNHAIQQVKQVGNCIQGKIDNQ